MVNLESFFVMGSASASSGSGLYLIFRIFNSKTMLVFLFLFPKLFMELSYHTIIPFEPKFFVPYIFFFILYIYTFHPCFFLLIYKPLIFFFFFLEIIKT